jgi:hypothetical protein
MTKRRIILTALLIIPISLLAASLLRPGITGDGSKLQMLFFVIGVPLAVLATLEWTVPAALDEFLQRAKFSTDKEKPKRSEDKREDVEEH